METNITDNINFDQESGELYKNGIKLMSFGEQKDFNNSIWNSWDEVKKDLNFDNDHFRIIEKQTKFIIDHYKKFTNEDAIKAFYDLHKLQMIGRSIVLISYSDKIESIREKFFGKFEIEKLLD